MMYRSMKKWWYGNGKYAKSQKWSSASKQAQIKINQKIPEKAHEIITDGIKNFIKMTLTGSRNDNEEKLGVDLTLEERDRLLMRNCQFIDEQLCLKEREQGRPVLLVGLADFPLLLSIKMKFLFEAASVYGYDTKKYEERIFILQVFQLLSPVRRLEKKRSIIIENWEERKLID